MKINKDEDNNNGSQKRTELEKLFTLLGKFVNDGCSEAEREAIEAWYETLSGERETMAAEELAAKQRIWARIRAIDNSSGEETSKVPVHQHRRWLAWAASIAVLCVSFVFAYLYMQKQHLPVKLADLSEKDWTIQSNATQDEMRLLLPDSSRIILKPDATVGYSRAFNEAERLVKLDGEAFFEIEKDVTRPFKVVTGNITTRVLGTSFNVKAIGEQSVIEVDVRTGKVSVYEHNQSDSGSTAGVVLTPNERVTYYKNESKWVAELVKDPLPVAAGTEEASALIFKDDLMRNVLERIAAVYCIEIIVVNDAIYDCPFTGDVSHMELYDMLKLICKSIGSDYEIRGTRILIDGAGCA